MDSEKDKIKKYLLDYYDMNEKQYKERFYLSDEEFERELENIITLADRISKTIENALGDTANSFSTVNENLKVAGIDNSKIIVPDEQKPNRETIINEDDLLNLKIDLERFETIDQFIQSL